MAVEPVALTYEMMWVLGILGLTVFLFAFEVVRVDVAALVVLVLLGLSALVPGYAGLVPPEHLFDGFSSNAVISIIAVMIIGAGLDKTGVMGTLASKILYHGGNETSRVISIVSSTVAVISSFMQNIGAAALFLPVVSRISKRANIPLSRLLMPMGFCAILGGTLTMIGSSPLILLNDLILNANKHLPAGVQQMDTWGLFSVTPIGLALVASGIAYFVFLGDKILPALSEQGSAPSNLEHFRNVYGIDASIFELRVTQSSDLAGLQLRDVEQRGRAGGWILAVRNAYEMNAPAGQDTEIWVGSELAIMGPRQQVAEWAEQHGLKMKPQIESFSEYMSAMTAGIAEAVIPPDSSLIGKTIRELNFRKSYGGKVLAVFRVNKVIDEDLGSLTLQSGDTLVMHIRWQRLIQMAKSNNFAVVTDFPRDEFRPEKLRHAAISFGVALGLVILTDIRLSVALLTGAMGMILTKVVSIEEAYRAVSWQSVFLLASLIPLGLATEATGTAAWVAQETLAILDGVPNWVVQAAVAVLATAFTLLMSNVGATVLLVPLAVNMAIGAGADPAVFALTVALATSNSFLLPTHQVNALIMGPAGYRVIDFLRAGGGMTLLFLAVMLVMLGIFY